ncbi:hypothetical protein [Laspinema olomoucense]|uniref:hypothetical protein n=1 Tax=Laspinema olomoucense TaxID=3231600 RepID=UPI0021BA3F5A|nr:MULTISPECIES: hypothetical protein [unclassified Laspinema]MCT7973174.1 hypothetical protein [Laspinema sp. D3d]MCT7993194.1 hypothetical protein [Laspinema sp. D3c]
MNASLLTQTVLGTAAAGLTLLVVSANPLFAQRAPGQVPPMTLEQMQQQHEEMRVQMEEMRGQMQGMMEHCQSMMNSGGMGHGQGSGMMGPGHSSDQQNHQNHQNPQNPQNPTPQ